MFSRLTKTTQSLAYLALIYISWKWFVGELDWSYSVACVSLSALWLGLTAYDSRELFRNYFDVLSRLKIILPLLFGLALSGLALLAPNHASETIISLNVFDWKLISLTPLKLFAIGELVGWGLLYLSYRRNKNRYKTQGHGPLPKGAWVNPHPDALQDGDLILTSGRVAKRLHETVGHGEMVMQINGKRSTWSSFMDRGAVVQDLKEVAETNLKYGHYVALRLSKPLDDTQKQIAPQLVAIMLEQNKRWKEETLTRRLAFYQRFHLPQFLRKLIDKKLPVSGYDWWGLFTGRLARDHWTCIGAVLDLYGRLGIKTNNYGTGLFGLGTGLLDPIKPVRFLGDGAFRLLNDSDKLAFEATLNSSSSPT
ncbi:MAG: hypothetical protein WCT03_21355 [Candidatus Obscuribacterales bacterium]|jgi:hypothetical protein